MAPAPGTSNTSTVHLPPIAADVNVLQRTESHELSKAWAWWHTLLTKAADTYVQSLHIEPEHDHYRLRSRGVANFDEELLRSTDELISALRVLVERLWDVEIPAKARTRQYLKLQRDKTTLIVSVDCIETSSGSSFFFSLIVNPDYRPTLDELGFEGKQLGKIRELLNDASGMLLVLGNDPLARAAVVRAMAQDLNSPDRKIIAAESLVHPYLPRINQVIYPGGDHCESLSSKHWQRAVKMDADAVVTVNPLPAVDRAQLYQFDQYVISCLSGIDSKVSIHQLLSDGATPQWIATSLQAIVVQHRVRTLCQSCFRTSNPNNEESAWISGIQPRISDNFSDWLTVNMERSYIVSPGCSECHQTGIAGFKNVFQIIEPSADTRENLLNGNIKAALATLDRSLNLDKRLLKLAADGEISINEAMRVADSSRTVY